MGLEKSLYISLTVIDVRPFLGLDDLNVNAPNSVYQNIHQTLLSKQRF